MKHYSFLIFRENYFNCDINSISTIEELIVKKNLITLIFGKILNLILLSLSCLQISKEKINSLRDLINVIRCDKLLCRNEK
jgi:hypothetical protein